ncbi:DNA polymerase beta superfamily protein [Streptomyces sp. NPDC059740]|uniref:nucleotidyltransferase domain-containing protein n=1 Tax=Streptomyces sp. NPDC059740 TaxID=3346926 RepID=UPI00365FF7DB
MPANSPAAGPRHHPAVPSSPRRTPDAAPDRHAPVPHPACCGERTPGPLHLVERHTVLTWVTGSRAQGLAMPDSDTDRRGVYLAPTASFWGLDKPPAHLTGPRPEEFSWELERFLHLALRSNPTVLECLFSPLLEYADETGRALLDLRGAFLSRAAAGTFTGYADRQQARLAADRSAGRPPRPKHALHLLRTLLTCRDLLRTGELTLDVGPAREELLAVRAGELDPAYVAARAEDLRREVAEAALTSPLPPHPDRDRVEAFLRAVRRRSAGA